MAKTKKSKKLARVQRRVRVRSALDNKADAYRRLLIDPCHGPLVPPTAIGPTTGLLVRQRYIQQLSSVATGPDGFIALLRPSTGELKHVTFGAAGSVTAETLTTLSLETGILTSARAYRAVAACMKFIPTGSIGNRSGVVAIGYTPDDVTDPVASGVGTVRATYANALTTMSQRTLANSSSPELPEVKWFPSGPEDLEFRQKSITYNADTACCSLVGTKIDNNGASGLNGYLDITIVWEWVPAYDAGVVSSVQVGSRNTLADVLRTLGDLSRTATDHMYASMLGGVKRMARDVTQAVIAGAAVNYMSSPSLLMGGS